VTDYSDRKGDWIITYTGKRFYPLDPREEDINIEDIAHSLSLINRFTGHTKFPYSVAQHSLDVAHALATWHDVDKSVQLAGLLHDASEAYVNDLARPLKRMLPDYTAAKNKILDVIDQKFKVNTRVGIVKLADSRALVTEAPQLCNGEGWWSLPQWPEPYPYTIHQQPWYFSEEDFLQKYEELELWRTT
jgi:5'-nucleotidase